MESGREDREEKQKFRAPDITESLNYVEVLAAILVIASEVLSEALPLEAAEDILLFIANTISFAIAYCNYNGNEKKKVGEDNDKLSNERGNSLIPGLILAGSAILLLKRVLLLASSVSPAVGPIFGFMGAILLLIGSVLAARTYSERLTDVEVSGHKNLDNSNIIAMP